MDHLQVAHVAEGVRVEEHGCAGGGHPPVRAALHEQTDHRLVRRKVEGVAEDVGALLAAQRRVVRLQPHVDVRAGVEQRPRDVLAPFHHRVPKRAPAVSVGLRRRLEAQPRQPRFELGLSSELRHWRHLDACAGQQSRLQRVQRAGPPPPVLGALRPLRRHAIVDELCDHRAERVPISLDGELGDADRAVDPLGAADPARAVGDDIGARLHQDDLLRVAREHVRERLDAAPPAAHPRAVVADRSILVLERRRQHQEEVGGAHVRG